MTLSTILPACVSRCWCTEVVRAGVVHSATRRPVPHPIGRGTLAGMPRLVLAPNAPAYVALLAVAREQGGVVSRRQIYSCGLTRWHVRGQLRARRWRALSDQAICVHHGPVEALGMRWAAVLQGGPRAYLDGAEALIAAGLVRFTSDSIRVTVPRGARIRRSLEFDIRQTRRWVASDCVSEGIPRARPAVAAVHGALWARSDRQAVLLMTMAVQQGLVRPEDLGLELLRVRRDRRRRLLQAAALDLLGGARSLGELDIVGMLRRRGLPPPERQVLRRDGKGRYYLDLYWPDWHLVVEIDGIHHTWAENIVADALRQNALSLAGDTVLRLPLLGLRLAQTEFLDQIEAALVAQGFRHAA